MAEYLITGGGAALDDALNKRNGFNYTNGDVLWVGPGIYSPVSFAQYLKNVEVRSTEGKERTIIDANHLTSCLDNRFTNSGYYFDFYGFTLRNGYISTDISGNSLSNYQDVEGARTFNLSGAALNGAIRLYDSNVFDCMSYCKYPYARWKNNDAYGSIAGIASANPNHYFTNCEISGCWTNTMFLRYAQLYGCNFHHNECTYNNNGDKLAWQGGNCYKNRIHHNRLSGIFLTNSNIADSLIYRNEGATDNWLGERTHIFNSVIANNTGFKIEDGWGGATYWKNNIIYGNKRVNGSPCGATFYGNNGRSKILNNFFDQLSTTLNWYNFNALSGTRIENNMFMPGVDPGFVDQENDDYRLRPDSILVGKGTWEVLSGKSPTDTTISYDGTGMNSWLSANGDFTSRKFNDPPIIGSYEHIEEEPHIPNDIYPFGMVSIPTSKPSVPSNWTYKITFENVDTSNADSYDAGLRNYSNVVYYKGPFNLSPGGSTIFTIYVDTNNPDPTQFSDCTGMCMADPGSGGNFVMLWNNMLEFANVNGGYNTDTPTAQMHDGVTGTITIEKKVS